MTAPAAPARPAAGLERATDDRGVVDRLNPVAKLLAPLLLAVVLLLTIDPVSAGVALAITLAMTPATRIGWRSFWVRTAPVWVSALGAGVTIVLYGRPSGTVHLEWLLVRVSDGSIALAVATALRVLAIGVPAVVLFARVDPTELGDGLAQVLRLPARFVLGAVAAIRLVALFREDWRSLELARRARGVADRGRLRRWAGIAFALLVLSIRRGSALATAMEARGFGAPVRRTWARESRFGAAEWALIALGAGVAAASTGAAILAGTWSFVAR